MEAHPPRRRRTSLGSLLVIALVALALPVVASDTAAADNPAGGAWSVSGPAGATVTNDGSTGLPAMSYSVVLAGGGVTDRTWAFQSVAANAGTLDVDWHYSGFHAYFQVRVHLEAYVTHNGVTTTTPLLTKGPINCCTAPSGGFTYDGEHTFSVAVGDTFGFRLGGSNFDSNSTLTGSFGLTEQTFTPAPPSTPYTPAAAATIADNTSWVTATTLSGSDAGTIGALGEARWYKFPVVPSSQVQVDLTDLAQNYDLTIYGDISAAFATLTSTKDLTTLSAQFAGDAYAPGVYSPGVYSPGVYSPGVYSPGVYSPGVYSPGVYSPGVYSPGVYSPGVYSPGVYSPGVYSPGVYSPGVYSPGVYSPDPTFVQAFSSAQTRSLLAASANEGTTPESIDVNTWNNTGSFYVRVQGRNGAFDATHPFTITLTTTGGPCNGLVLDTHAGDATLSGSIAPGAAGPSTVIVTDSSRWNPTAPGAADLRGRLDLLASSTNGIVVDVSGSAKVAALQRQADDPKVSACPYAKNLVAQAIRDIANSYRDSQGSLKYVVLVGGDTVLPYFRYADGSGLGPESDFVPPVLDSTPAQAALRNDMVLGQDAYGSLVDLPQQGGVLPLPDLAVGRLVETPAEIEGMIDAYLGLANGVLPTPTSSLVTGYDFLTSAADSVQSTLRAGLGSNATTDALITEQGVPAATTTTNGKPDRTHSWTAADLSDSLLSTHHDLVFLAGHFSANSTLAADYRTSLITTQLEAHPGVLKNSLVFSAGCHSGYNLQDADINPVLALGLDWAEEMARQQATFVGGTGYQYADTDFLAYSAKIYAGFTRQLLVGSGPVAVGQALVKAKQTYLAGLTSVSGIDQKALIESAVYGLPMTSVNMPGQRTPAPTPTPGPVTPHPVLTGTPGSVLGLQTADHTVPSQLDGTTNGQPSTKVAVNLDPNQPPVTLQWHTGPGGAVQTGPALPTLPVQTEDVTSSGGDVLRGVGLRSADYTDSLHITPLTGAPGTEQSGVHSTFSPSSFWPQKLANVNYFDALSPGGTGTTKLVTTPVQYRGEPGRDTATERVYQDLQFSLYYSKNVTTYGGNTPALAAPPSITGVTGSASGGTVTVSAHVTGDPSAGIQDVWATYTGETGDLHGHWRSVDLHQDPTDSTLWTGTFQLGSTPAADARLVVQAANGVGLVSMDDAFGDGYTPGVQVGVIAPTATATSITLDDAPTSAVTGSSATVGATLVGAPAGSTVTFTLAGSTASGVTNSNGHATARLAIGAGPGATTLSASYAGSSTLRGSTAARAITVAAAPTTLTLGSITQTNVPGGVQLAGSVSLTRSDSSQPLAQQTVQILLNGVPVASASTDLNGAGRFTTSPVADGAYDVSAAFAATSTAAAATAAVQHVWVDTTGPSVVVVATPAANANGWNNTDVTVSFQCDDASGVANCPPTRTLQASATVSETVSDNVGNITTTPPLNVQIDKVAPTLTGTPTTSANAAGWYQGDVVVQWACSDAGSDLDGVCPAAATITGEGGALSAQATVADRAGNSTTTTFTTKIDRTAPVTTAAVNTAKSTASTIVIDLNATDGGSGVATTSYQVDNGPVQQGNQVSLVTGGHTLVFWSVDLAGNIEAAHVDLDSNAITDTITPTPNINGWTHQATTVTFHCSDPQATCTAPVVLTSEGKSQLVVGVSVGSKGVAFDSAHVSIDLTAPRITTSSSPAPNAAGWWRTPVTVTFSCSDALSGIATCSTGSTVSTEGRNQSVSGTASDVAGNTTNAVVGSINIDRTAPTVTITGVVPKGRYTMATAPTPACSTTDALSGVKTAAVLETSSEGALFEVECSGARDVAGNAGAEVETTYTITDLNPTALAALATSYVLASGRPNANGTANKLSNDLKTGKPCKFVTDVQAEVGQTLTSAQAATLVAWGRKLASKGDSCAIGDR